MGKMRAYQSVDDYFDDQPEEILTRLLELRQCILDASPQAEEKINYGIPAYALIQGGKRDQQVMIAAYKKHISFYPTPSVIEAFQEQLQAFETSKGTVQFKLTEPLPKELITEMVRFRMEELGITH